EEAERLYQRSLTIYEQVLGPEHPDTASTLNNLALLYKNQGRYEEAERLCQRSLTIYEQVFGPDHPKTVTVRQSYQRMLQQREKRRRRGLFSFFLKKRR